MVGSQPHVLVIILIAILITTLGINYYFHQREEERNRRRLLSKQLQKQISDTLNALQTLKTIRCPQKVIDTLSEHSITMINRLRALNPDSGIVEQLQSQSGQPPASDAPPVLTSASAIHNVQSGIRHAISTLLKVQQQGKITPLDFAEFKKELAWLSVEVEADAHLEQGDKFAKTDKIALAMTHFKQAKAVVAKAATKDPRKQLKIQAINKMLEDINPFKKQPEEAPSNDTDAPTAGN